MDIFMGYGPVNGRARRAKCPDHMKQTTFGVGSHISIRFKLVNKALISFFPE